MAGSTPEHKEIHDFKERSRPEHKEIDDFKERWLEPQMAALPRVYHRRFRVFTLLAE
jgi:hypothetical protein